MGRLLAALVLLVVGVWVGSAEAAELYQRKTIAVFGSPRAGDSGAPGSGGPAAAFLKEAFQSLGRFDFEEIPTRHADDLYDFLDRYQQRVEDTAADKAARGLMPDEKFREVIVDGDALDRVLRSAYALVPQGRFSRWIQLEPQVTVVSRDGRFYRRTSLTFRSHYTFRLMVYDLAERRVIARYATRFPLDHTLSREVRISAEEAKKPQKVHLDRSFRDEIALLLMAHPRERLLAQAHGRLYGEVPVILKWAKSLDPFIIKSEVLAADWEHDEIRMVFGRDAGIRTDNGYRVVRRIKREDGGFESRDVGLIKVRRVEATMSVAQALIVDEPFAPGDLLIERPKLDWNAAVKAGIAPFRVSARGVTLPYGARFPQAESGVVATLTLANEVGLGATTGISEFYGLLDASAVLGAPYVGLQGEIGLLRKQFHRRWGWYYGGKLGVLHVMAASGPAVVQGISYPTTTVHADAPGVSGLFGVTYHLTPDALFSVDLGLQAYLPTRGWTLTGQARDRELSLWLGNSGGLPSVSASGMSLRAGIAVAF